MTTFAEIQEVISANALNPKDHFGIAAKLSEGNTKLRTTEIGKGTVLAVLPLAIANGFLDVIDNVADFRHVKEVLAARALDLSLPSVRGAIDSLVGMAPGFLQEHADALKNVASYPVTISMQEVASILDRGE